MKIKTWIKYEESYLLPNSKIKRYRECEEYIFINLKEISQENLRLAFEDNSEGGQGKIYFYDNKLWRKFTVNPDIISNLQKSNKDIKTALDYLIYCHEYCSSYFLTDWDRLKYGKDTSKKAVIKAAESDIKKYVLINGELYEETFEPIYEVFFNQDGTGMLCIYDYDPNTKEDNYFSALHGKQAVSYANKLAKDHGDIKRIGTFKPFIICHMPELVKMKF